MTPEDVGVLRYTSPTDKVVREYRVWVFLDPTTGEVDFVSYVNSSLQITNSFGPLKRSECKTPLEKAVFAFAEEQVSAQVHDEEGIDDFAVIEPFESNVYPLHRRH